MREKCIFINGVSRPICKLYGCCQRLKANYDKPLRQNAFSDLLGLQDVLQRTRNVNELFDKSDNFKLPEKGNLALLRSNPPGMPRLTEVKKGLRIFRPLPNSFFEQFLKKLPAKSNVGYYELFIALSFGVIA